jgi:hypothetical protein
MNLFSQKSGFKGYINLEAAGRRRNLYPEVHILDSGGAEFWYQEVKKLVSVRYRNLLSRRCRYRKVVRCRNLLSGRYRNLELVWCRNRILGKCKNLVPDRCRNLVYGKCRNIVSGKCRYFVSVRCINLV